LHAHWVEGHRADAVSKTFIADQRSPPIHGERVVDGGYYRESQGLQAKYAVSEALDVVNQIPPFARGEALGQRVKSSQA